MKPFNYAVLAMALAPLPALGESGALLVDVIAQGSTAHPANGTPMEQVEARYGDPAEQLAPVGEPPITRWVYDDFTVYFEYDRVITAVLHR